MTSVEEIMGLSAEPSSREVQWGRPVFYSSLMHALALSVMMTCWINRTTSPEPIKVFEINVMGNEELALTGVGPDPNVGPMPEKSVMVVLPKHGGKVVHGNTSRLSQALSVRPVAKLTAKGPLFGSADGRAGGADSGVGQEKIYLKNSAARLARSSASPSGDGEGLVGVPGGPVDLRARRGAGGAESGHGGFLGGGLGSVEGGSQLMRKGESIVVRYPTVSDDIAGQKSMKMDLPQPSDDFFSIRGPLSRRKILKINLPRYPRWAEEQGVETQASVWLSVTANGRVKTNLYIEQTSGYPAFDQLVLEAIQRMLFAPMSDTTSSQEESGVATFNFRLRKTSGKNENL